MKEEGKSYFQCIALPARSMKPRQDGLTMILDKGIGVNAFSEYLVLAGAYIDIVKFGWGTSRILPKDVVHKKIVLANDYHVKVCPGGTFLELAYLQGVVAEFLREAYDVGFRCIEVSDGTIHIAHDEKLHLIELAKQMGFAVFSEIGKKFWFEDKRLSLGDRIEQAHAELAAGSSKVIIEAREAGSVGIFGADGAVHPEDVAQLIDGIGLTHIIFEAPRPDQQRWLIANLGNTVNMGNIALDTVISLETLRCGLRADTLKQFHLGDRSVRIENGMTGVLAAVARSDVIILVDTLTSSSIFIAALAAGVKSIKLLVDDEYTTGDLSKMEAIDLDDFSISQAAKFSKQPLAVKMNASTQLIHASDHADSPVLIGALLNAKAVADKAMDMADQKDITIVMGGDQDDIAEEDLIAASEIFSYLNTRSLKGNIRPIVSEDYITDFLASKQGCRLTEEGYKDEVVFCAQKNKYSTVPVYQDGVLMDCHK